jgi:hypothetical protein
MSRSSGRTKNEISPILDGLVSSFSGVLMLLVGFTLPVVDTESAQYVGDFMTDNGLTAVTDEFQGGTTLDDVILQVLTNCLSVLIP